jgi:CxxC motif-containing protein (DUF1111 family)
LDAKPVASAALQNLTVHAYSDLLIHHMGRNLADDITQGLATGDMFRSTPLWGVGQRRFFLHDGRTNDLLKAIEAHYSRAMECDDGDGRHAAAGCGCRWARRCIRRYSSNFSSSH